MYTYSNYSGKTYLNKVEVDMHDEDYIAWVRNGGILTVENTVTDIEQKQYVSVKTSENEFQSYLKRKADGENAYLKLSAEFRLAKLSGQISEETHSYLEELLTPVRNEVMFGQWKKGLSILENLGVSQIGADLYSRLHAQISNYIIENY